MSSSVRAVFGALMLTISATGFGYEFKKGDLIVDHPWTRASARGQTVAAGYLEVRNGGKQADREQGGHDQEEVYIWVY